MSKYFEATSETCEAYNNVVSQAHALLSHTALKHRWTVRSSQSSFRPRKTASEASENVPAQRASDNSLATIIRWVGAFSDHTWVERRDVDMGFSSLCGLHIDQPGCSNKCTIKTIVTTAKASMARPRQKVQYWDCAYAMHRLINTCCLHWLHWLLIVWMWL